MLHPKGSVETVIYKFTDCVKWVEPEIIKNQSDAFMLKEIKCNGMAGDLGNGIIQN